MQARAEVAAIGDGKIDELESEWRAVEQAAGESPFHCWHWLAGWARIYEPRHLSVARVWRPGGELLAIGLIERASGGRWRFAGGWVTPCRGLICAPKSAPEAWSALLDWMAAHPGTWSTLDAEGLEETAVAQADPAATRPGKPVFALDLPDSFDGYLAQRRPTTRKGLKQKLRRLSAAEAVVRPVAAADTAAALEKWVLLHHTRARAKGERHPQIDHRLTALLGSLTDVSTPRVRLFELLVGDRTAGVTVRLDVRGTGCFYNAGIDPAALRLSPGVVLELESIRDAIERGLTRFDLGPGDYRYKADLGGAPSARLDLRAVSPAPRGRVVARAADTNRAARDLAKRLLRARHRDDGARS